MVEITKLESPPRRSRWRQLSLLLLLAVAAVLWLDAADRLPPEVKDLCAEVGLCGHEIVQDVLLDVLPGGSRETRLEFLVAASSDAQQAAQASVLAERQGDSWILKMSIDALPGAHHYSLLQLLATRGSAPGGQPTNLILHDENRQPVLNGRWEVTARVPNEVFRSRDWVLQYRADTLDALAVSEDIAPHIRRTGAIR